MPLSRQRRTTNSVGIENHKLNLWFQLKVSPFPFICGTNKQPTVGVAQLVAKRNKVMSSGPNTIQTSTWSLARIRTRIQPASQPTSWPTLFGAQTANARKTCYFCSALGNGKSFSHPFCNKIIIYFLFTYIFIYKFARLNASTHVISVKVLKFRYHWQQQCSVE